MTRIVSFIALVVAILVIGVVFYYVMIPFFLPLFLALLLAVVFQPLHAWMLRRLKNRQHVAAAATTSVIVAMVLLPLGYMVASGVSEGLAFYRQSAAGRHDQPPAAEAAVEEKHAEPKAEEPTAIAILNTKELAATAVKMAASLGIHANPERTEQSIREFVDQWVPPIALNAARFTVDMAIGLAVLLVSLFYFFADGPAMLRAVMKLSPLDSQYVEQLIDQFVNITRAVVVATLGAAAAQGLLAGVGYLIAGVPTVLLLTLLTTLFAIVPVVGATAVWLPVCLWLYFVQERHVAAVVLAIYCLVIVSSVDNLLKPAILHGRSNLHPLWALLSVLGGVKALGPVGIFVGPMVVAFLHALLKIFQGELEKMREQEKVAAT